jgi:hypothetical protein
MNPNSLKNLTPGSNKPFKKQLTKQIQSFLAEYLTDNFEDFSQKMNEMSAKEYVTAYIKLLALVTPRKTDVTFDPEASQLIDWTLNVVPNPNKAAS